MVFVTRFGRCFTGINLRHRVVCNIGLCLKNFIVPVHPRYRVRLHLPNSPQIIIAVSVDKDRIACCVFNRTAVPRGCPAAEFVAYGGFEADIAKRFYDCVRILRVIIILKGSVIVVAIFICEIIMILNRHGLGLIGVDCPQRGVLCDGNLIARVDERVVFRFPRAEVFGIFRRKYAGGAAAYILLVIRFYIRTLNVCDREAILCGGEERGNRNGAVKLGIYIEQRAVGINPSGGLFRERFKQFLKLFGIRKLFAVRNFNRYRFSVRRGTQINCCVDLRRLPLCIERNVLCGHRLAVEDICRAFARLVLIPACKRKVCGYTGRFCRVVVGIGNILLILAANLSILRTLIHEYDIIGVAGIVEFGIIVFAANRSTYICVKSKTCNRILIFFCYSITRTGACIRMMQFILNSIIGCSATLTGENFHIIICSLTTITGLRSIELGAA